MNFQIQQAPGEAEAELAQLNKAGIIDIVLSDDSDVLLFGATHIMRK
jgi:Holliday junction resolvase YEN1